MATEGLASVDVFIVTLMFPSILPNLTSPGSLLLGLPGDHGSS